MNQTLQSRPSRYNMYSFISASVVYLQYIYVYIIYIYIKRNAFIIHCRPFERNRLIKATASPRLKEKLLIERNKMAGQANLRNPETSRALMSRMTHNPSRWGRPPS